MNLTMRVRTILTLCATPLLAVGVVAPLAVAVAPAGAQTAGANPSSADAYGVLVDVRLLQGNVPVKVGPLVESSSANPPGGPNSNSLVSTGPIPPPDGSLVQSLGVITTSTNADGTPQSTATAETAKAALLPQAGIPTITADVIKAQSNTNCTAAPNSTGTQFVNLKVGPVVVPANPPANTTIALGAVTVIVNEQHPTADGRGLVVNGVHIIAPGTLGGTPFPTQALIQGDIIISHAVSTVVCPGTFDQNGNPIAGAPGGSTATPDTTPIEILKTPSPSAVAPGGTVTYTAKITNRGKSQCLVNEVIDHLPVGFTPTSTSGALGTKESSSARPDKGTDVIVVPPADVIIPPNGGSVTQTFVVTASQTPGTYANNVELLCSDLGDFEATGAPVTVNAPAAATPATGNGNSGAGAPPAAQLPRTGGPSPLIPIGGAAILGGGILAAARRRTLRTRRADVQS